LHIYPRESILIHSFHPLLLGTTTEQIHF